MQLERLKQTSTVAKYVEEFTRLKALLPPGLRAERSFKRVFVMGLKPVIRPLVLAGLRNDAVTLDDIINDALMQATGVEAGWADDLKTYSNRWNEFKASTNADAMELDAVSFKKLRPQEKKVLMANGGCFKCRKTGHFARQCPMGGKKADKTRASSKN